MVQRAVQASNQCRCRPKIKKKSKIYGFFMCPEKNPALAPPRSPPHLQGSGNPAHWMLDEVGGGSQPDPEKQRCIVAHFANSDVRRALQWELRSPQPLATFLPWLWWPLVVCPMRSVWRVFFCVCFFVNFCKMSPQPLINYWA